MEHVIKKRIESIDILRGLVMVIMALDHVRDYFHIGANLDDPLNLETTTPLLFFTRWITHFCAPIFIFLSGISIYLQSLRKSHHELARFVITRGLWLILMESVIVSFGWTFNPNYFIIPFQVIWAIGISMFILGIFIWLRLPYWLMLSVGLLIVLAHNLLDIPESESNFQTNFWWDVIHHGVFTPYTLFGNHAIMLVYPFLPWLGVMLLGYCAGILFSNTYTETQRKNNLIMYGSTFILLFMLIRFTNSYGDSKLWVIQKNGLLTVFSFVNTSKYPPSLLYLLMTIGPAFIALAYIENLNRGISKFMIVFGRTAFFYYVLHLYLIHLLAAISFFVNGHTIDDVAKVGAKYPFLFVVPGEGYGLFSVYLIWFLVVLLLYPICKWYDQYKTKHKDLWWLSYL